MTWFATARVIAALGCLSLWAAPAVSLAQEAPATAETVPLLVPFTGALPPASDGGMSGRLLLRFALHKTSDDTTALWTETQVVVVEDGRFGALLGLATPLPIAHFATGEARWVEVATESGARLLRTMITSVPYAMKAGDAATLGGRPASDYALASTVSGARAAAAAGPPGSGGPPSGAAVRGTGTAGAVSMWLDGTTIGNSPISIDAAGHARVAGDVYAANYRDAAGNLIPNGDVTDVIAGEGLTGGGFSGSLAMAIDKAFTDARYAALTHGHTVAEIAGAATLGANTFSGNQQISGALAATTGNFQGGVVARSAASQPAFVGVATGSATAIQAVADGGQAILSQVSGAGVAVNGIARGGANSRGVMGQSTVLEGPGIGVSGHAHSPEGIGVEAHVNAATGATRGLAASVRSLDGTAGDFTNTANGDVIRAGAGSQPTFRVDAAGNVFANGFRTLAGTPLPNGDVTGITPGYGITAAGDAGNIAVALNTSDTDLRYASKSHGHTAADLPANLATLGANTFVGDQHVTGKLTTVGQLSATHAVIQTSSALPILSVNNLADIGNGVSVTAGSKNTTNAAIVASAFNAAAGVRATSTGGIGVIASGITGMLGSTNASGGVGVSGSASGTNGMALAGTAFASTGTAARLAVPGGGNLIVGTGPSGNQNFRVDASGIVYAMAYRDLNGNPINAGPSAVEMSCELTGWILGGVNAWFSCPAGKVMMGFQHGAQTFGGQWEYRLNCCSITLK